MSTYRRKSSTQSEKERKQSPNLWEGHVCRECVNVVEVTRFHTLDVHERKPTMGRCPYYCDGQVSLLLSLLNCHEHFDLKNDGKTEGDKPEG